MTDNWDIQHHGAGNRPRYLCPVCDGAVNVIDKYCRHCGTHFDEPSEVLESSEPDEQTVPVPMQINWIPVILAIGGAAGMIIVSFAPQIRFSGMQAQTFNAIPGLRQEFRFSNPRWVWPFVTLWVPCAAIAVLSVGAVLERWTVRVVLGAAMLGVAGLMAFERLTRALNAFATVPRLSDLSQQPSWAAWVGIVMALLPCAAAALLVRAPATSPAAIEPAPVE